MDLSRYLITTTKSRLGGGDFVPTDINGCVHWAKTDAITGLNDGDPIGTAPAEVGNDFTQSTASNKLTYKANIVNGLPAMYSDGYDFLTTSLASGLDDFTFIISFNILSGSHSALSGFGTYDPGIRVNTAPSEALAIHDDGYENFTDLVPSDNTWYVAMFWRTGGKYYASLNNSDSSQEKSVSFSTTSTDFALASIRQAQWNSDSPYYIQEEILYNSALSAGDRTSVYDYMAARLGL